MASCLEVCKILYMEGKLDEKLTPCRRVTEQCIDEFAGENEAVVLTNYTCYQKNVSHHHHHHCNYHDHHSYLFFQSAD